MSREAQTHQALEILGVERFVRFIRAIRHEGEVFAVELINKSMDAGEDVKRASLSAH